MAASGYPHPSSAAATAVMKANHRVDTRPERALRSALHRQGERFRKDFSIRAGDVRVRPDIVFTRRRLAVFVDGCFWHRCPQHATSPRSNSEYWRTKLDGNVARDRRNDAALRADGWSVLRVWEHEPVEEAVVRVVESLQTLPGSHPKPQINRIAGSIPPAC
jgi:DNA mismatch endonuclease (patch repair protein)